MKNCMIITAAGMSTRQKQNKLLIRSCNETIIEKTINNFINNNMDIFIVVGHQKEILIPILKHRFRNDIRIIVNNDYESGIASSINAGMKAAEENYEYFGFCNGDKPFIKIETIQFMLKYLEENQPNILVPLFQEQSGHPTFFLKKYFKDFLLISGDTGGRELIKKYPDAATYLPIDDEGIITDMDMYLKNNNHEGYE